MTHIYYYKGWHTSNATCFFLINYSYSCNEIYVCHENTCFTELALYFNKVFFITTTLFPTLTCDSVCQSCKTLCWSIRALHARYVSTHRCLQSGILGVHPSGCQKDGSWGRLNQYCREDEGRLSAVLLKLPPLCTDWCAVWHCPAGRVLDSYYSMLQPFEFIVLTFIISAHFALNWLWHLSPRIILNQQVKLALVCYHYHGRSVTGDCQQCPLHCSSNNRPKI